MKLSTLLKDPNVTAARRAHWMDRTYVRFPETRTSLWATLVAFDGQETKHTAVFMKVLQDDTSDDWEAYLIPEDAG